MILKSTVGGFHSALTMQEVTSSFVGKYRSEIVRVECCMHCAAGAMMGQAGFLKSS